MARVALVAYPDTIDGRARFGLEDNASGSRLGDQYA